MTDFFDYICIAAGPGAAISLSSQSQWFVFHPSARVSGGMAERFRLRSAKP